MRSFARKVASCEAPGRCPSEPGWTSVSRTARWARASRTSRSEARSGADLATVCRNLMSEPEKQPGFEDAQRELDDIVARLERGDVPIDDAIALWQRGEELYRRCAALLDAAEGRIEELAHDVPGSDAG